jgi:hypothetical protein
MGICWSEPPVSQQPPITSYPMKPCVSCGSWIKGNDYCEPCLQRNAMKYVQPSAPPQYMPPQPQYTYAVPYQQQQMYNYYQARPPHQQQQIGTGTAVVGGFVLGALVSDMLDPTE